MLTDDVAIFWDPDTVGDINYPAMSLIRDAESVNYDVLLDQHQFLEEIFGDAIIIEGINDVEGFEA